MGEGREYGNSLVIDINRDQWKNEIVIQIDNGGEVFGEFVW